jgi:hypothetical protein
MGPDAGIAHEDSVANPPGGGRLPGSHRGEPRWAMATTVVMAAVLHATLPAQIRAVGQVWVYPTVVVGLLAVLVVGDPGRIDKRDRWLRVVTGLLIAFITIVNAVSAVHLVELIIANSDKQLGSADRLLGSGAAIWLINVLAFGLWYWDLDQGGAAERVAGTSRLPAFAFPEMSNQELVRTGWYPELIDYLHMSFGTSTALGPSDVSAIKHWSKIMMTLQSAVSLLLAVLIIARAINLLP